MLILANLILTGLIGAAGVILIHKWKIDDFMNTRGVRFWPREPCNLCRGFWVGAAYWAVFCYRPEIIYIALPFAAIPVQGFIVKLLSKNGFI